MLVGADLDEFLDFDFFMIEVSTLSARPQHVINTLSTAQHGTATKTAPSPKKTVCLGRTSSGRGRRCLSPSADSRIQRKGVRC